MSYSFGHCIVKGLMNTNSLRRFTTTDDGHLTASMRDGFSEESGEAHCHQDSTRPKTGYNVVTACPFVISIKDANAF